jgi:hypothetical protein
MFRKIWGAIIHISSLILGLLGIGLIFLGSSMTDLADSMNKNKNYKND